MIRTYTYKLYNNKRIERKFYEWCGICRYVYNTAKAAKEYAYESGVSLSKYDLMKQLPDCKTGELSFVKKVDSQTLQGIIERLDRSFSNFFDKRASYPKWASRKRFTSFGFKQRIKQTDKGFKLPKFGEVKIFNNRKIDGDVKTARLIRKADGIYLNVVVEVEDKAYHTNDSQVGIDMGISHFATLSNGTHIPNPRFLQNKLRKLRIEQRSLSRKTKGSNRWKKQARRVALLHKKVTDTRKDFLHKLSTQIATNYKDVAVEDLDIRKMLQNSHSDLARQISDASWAAFSQMLEYKCTNLVKVDAKNTSIECSQCGFIAEENRRSQSLFECASCGHTANADVDAAKVIEARAFADSRQREALACA